MKHTMKSFMMFKPTLIAASLGLLFAGNALAVTNGNFSNGLTGWAALGDVAVQSGAVWMTTASVAYEDDYPASTGAFNVTAASSPYAFSTGVGGFSYTFANAGVQRLSFGVVDVNDYSATSALWLDNVSVTPVPEPKDWMLMLAGLGLVGLKVSRNRNRTF